MGGGKVREHEYREGIGYIEYMYVKYHSFIIPSW